MLLLQMPDQDLEIKIIRKFIVQHKQDRYIQFVSSAKNRYKFINDLAHFKHFQWEHFARVTGNEIEFILNTLKKNSVESALCYIISEEANIDGKNLPILEAWSAISSYRIATILVFGDAEIVYYLGENIETNFISRLVK